MKLVLALLLLVSASNVFAACEAGKANACADAAECTRVVGNDGKNPTVFANGFCNLDASAKIPVCDQITSAGTTAGAKPTAGSDATGAPADANKNK